MEKIITQKAIEDDLKKLGVAKGDTFFLRVSYKAIGPLDGGPITFIKALENVIGEEGTIIMAAFPHKHIRQFRWCFRNEVYSKDHIAKPVTGIIPTLALTLPEAKISEKLEFPFVVIGKNADYLTSNHTHEKYGYWVFQEAIYKFGCKCLRVGGEPFVGSTHIAFDEVLKEKGYYQTKFKYGLYLYEDDKKKWYDTPNTIFCKEGLKNYVHEVVNVSKLCEGKVGNGYALITDMKKSLDKEMEMFRNNIQITLCDNPDCLYCRTSFSFSDESNWHFFKRQFLHLFTKERNKAFHNIFALVNNVLWGLPVQ